MVDKADRASAAGALADLFFAPPTPLEAQSVNELRHKYRDWRQAAGTVPHADVLDLNHHAKTDELRAFSKLRRVKTVGARLDKSKAHASSPVRRGACGECDGLQCFFGPSPLMRQHPLSAPTLWIARAAGTPFTPLACQCSPIVALAPEIRSQDLVSDANGRAGRAASTFGAGAPLPMPTMPPLVTGGGCPFRQDAPPSEGAPASVSAPPPPQPTGPAGVGAPPSPSVGGGGMHVAPGMAPGMSPTGMHPPVDLSFGVRA